MNTLSTRCLFPLIAVVTGLGLSNQALAKGAERAKPKMLRKIAKAERRLGPGIKGVEYDKRAYKYFKSTKVRLKADHSLVLTAWSAEFQPKLIVRRVGTSRILKHGTFERPTKRDGETWRVTHLEFIPQDRGIYVLTVTTDRISQDTYFIEGAIWGVAKSAPPVADADDTPSAGR